MYVVSPGEFAEYFDTKVTLTVNLFNISLPGNRGSAGKHGALLLIAQRNLHLDELSIK